MIRGVIRSGQVHLLEPVPEDWSEGREIRVEADAAGSIPDPEEFQTWVAELDRLAAQLDPEDEARIARAISEHRAEAKAAMRREMGLP